MSRWTLKIPCVHMNGKTGKEDWKKSAIETIQPSEETGFKIFYRVSSALMQTVSKFPFSWGASSEVYQCSSYVAVLAGMKTDVSLRFLTSSPSCKRTQARYESNKYKSPVKRPF